MLVSDSERERAVALLRRQFLRGRLSTAQLAERVELALAARHRRDVRRAFAGLPPSWLDRDEMQRQVRRAKRAAVRTLAGLAWAFVTLVLLVGFATSAIAHGVTKANTIGFSLVWLIVTALAWRVRRRA